MPAVGTGLTFLPAAKGGPEEGWDGKEEGPPPPARPTSRLRARHGSARRASLPIPELRRWLSR